MESRKEKIECSCESFLLKETLSVQLREVPDGSRSKESWLWTGKSDCFTDRSRCKSSTAYIKGKLTEAE